MQLVPRFNQITLLLACLTMVPFFAAVASDEDTVPENGLYLFLSEEEQMAVESMRASRSNGGEETKIEETKMEKGSSGLRKTGEPEAMSQEDESDKMNAEADTQPNLYNGAVLMGNEVLGLWIKGTQVVGSDCLQRMEVDRYGVVRLTSQSETVELRPGHRITDSDKLELMISDGEQRCIP